MIDDYILWLKSDGKSENTIRVYINALNKLINWYEDTEGLTFEINKVTTLHIHDFQSYMDKIEKLQPPTINKIIASLKTFFRFTIDMGILIYNPMLKIKMKRTMAQYDAPKWLSKYELAKFYHSIEQVNNDFRKIRNIAVCRLMSSAGLRVQEVSDLNINDIKIDNKINDVIVRDGKGGKFRIVPLNKDVVESLKEWFKLSENSNNDALFVSERNTRFSVRSIHSMVTKYANIAGLEDVSPHTLRHTFCKNLVDQGVGIERVAYLAGHESLETTRRYTLPSQNDLRNAVQTISERK